MKIYIVIEYIKDKLPGQSTPEVIGIKPHGAFKSKTAAEVAEFIKEQLPGQQFPEATGIKAYKAYADKRAAEAELLKHDPFTTKIITTTLQEG